MQNNKEENIIHHFTRNAQKAALGKKHPCLANIQQGKRTKSFPKRQPLKAQKAVKFII